MQRKTFLTIVSIVSTLIGCIASFAPAFLIGVMKGAETNGAAEVMARTVGVLLITMGILSFLVRGDGDSPTMRGVLIANMILQLAILPIDPLAYWNGVFSGLGSFVPNTILHVMLAGAFAYYLRAMPRMQALAAPVSG